MNATESEDLARVWSQVKNWPLRLQVSLARRILDEVDAAQAAPPVTRGKPVSALIGLGAGGGEPPSDETVRQWLDEHRMEKYGS
jgi:hypothetical protein